MRKEKGKGYAVDRLAIQDFNAEKQNKTGIRQGWIMRRENSAGCKQ